MLKENNLNYITGCVMQELPDTSKCVINVERPFSVYVVNIFGCSGVQHWLQVQLSIVTFDIESKFRHNFIYS